MVWYKHLSGILISLVFGIMLASMTEIIQLTVDNRSGEFTDVLLDTAGYIVGILIVLLIIYILNKPRQAINKVNKLNFFANNCQVWQNITAYYEKKERNKAFRFA